MNSYKSKDSYTKFATTNPPLFNFAFEKALLKSFKDGIFEELSPSLLSWPRNKLSLRQTPHFGFGLTMHWAYRLAFSNARFF